MYYEVIPTPKFEDDIKFYEKKRKYLHITDDVDEVVAEIKEGNLVGDPITEIKLPENEDAYKVRAVNTDTHSGKSNGYRIIYYAIKNEQTVYLLTIYCKKDDNRILSKKEIADLIEKYCN